PGNAIVLRPRIQKRDRRRQVAQLTGEHNRYPARLAIHLAIHLGIHLPIGDRRNAELRRNRHQQRRQEAGDAAVLTLIGASSHPETPVATTPPNHSWDLDHPDRSACQARRVRAKIAQYRTTLLMLLPACIRSNPLLMSGSGMVWVIIGSISILPSMYQSTIFGTSVRPRAPPNAVPFQTRPVTSWNGRVAISAPEGATPMM